MSLKNYTSEVPASTSMAKIEKALVAAGATDISKKYKDSICIAVRFRIMHKTPESPQLGTPLFFELPARVDACYKVLWQEIKRPLAGTQQKTRQQAERTAWKIISDWVEIQLAMIKLEQAEILQIFLPYVFDPKNEKTFFETIKSGGYKALLNQ